MTRNPYINPINLIFVFLLAGCGHFKNKVDKISILCGSDFNENTPFFLVLAPDGHTLSSTDIRITTIPNGLSANIRMSRNCVTKPTEGQILIHSREFDWARVIGASELKNISEVKLENYSSQKLLVSCDSIKTMAVNQQFSMDTIINSNISQSLREGFQIKYTLQNHGQREAKSSGFSLSSGGNSEKPFAGISDEGDYALKVIVRNLFKEIDEDTKICELHLDKTPPNVELNKNILVDVPAVDIHGSGDFILVHPSDQLTFKSVDPDLKEVQYCTKKLDDNFSEFDVIKSDAWKLDITETTCEKSTMRSTSIQTSILDESKSGLWSVRYQGIDKLGNVSIRKKALLFFYSKDKIDLIKNIAISNVNLAYLKNRSQEVLEEAFHAETMQRELATQFERDSVESAIRSAMLNTSLQEGIEFNLAGHESNISSVLVSADGKFFYSGSQDHTVKKWDAFTGKLLNSVVIGMVPSALVENEEDGSVFWAGFEGTIGIIDKKFSQATNLINADDRGTSALLISPDKKKLVSASYKSIKIWDISTKNLLLTLNGHVDQVTALVATKDFKKIISGSADETIRVWDLSTGEQVLLLDKSDGKVTSLALNGSNDKLISGYEVGKIKIWNLITGELSQKIPAKSRGEVAGIKFSPDDKFFAVASNVEIIRIWEIATISNIRNLVQPSTLIKAISYTPSGNRIIAGTSTQELGVWDLSNGAFPESLIKEKDPINAIAFVPKSNRIASAVGSVVNVFDLDLKKKTQELAGHTDTVIAMAVSPDGNIVVTAANDGKTIFWDRTGSQTLNVINSSGAVTLNLVFSSDGKLLISATEDGEINFRETTSGKILKSLKLNSVSHLMASKAGKLLTVEKDGTLTIWDINTFAPIQTIKDPSKGDISGISFNTQGDKIVTVSNQSVIRIWDLKTNKSIVGKGDNPGIVTSVAFASDGSIFTGSIDQCIRIWDSETGENTNKWYANYGGIYYMAMNSEETKLVSVPSSWVDENVTVWNISKRGVIDNLCRSLQGYINSPVCQ